MELDQVEVIVLYLMILQAHSQAHEESRKFRKSSQALHNSHLLMYTIYTQYTQNHD